MDKHGDMYVHEKPVIGSIHHSTIAAGEDPAGAGHIGAIDGRLTKLNESTGHFGENQPPGTVYKVANELESQGADISAADIEPWED
jgi:hypothetical protein